MLKKIAKISALTIGVLLFNCCFGLAGAVNTSSAYAELSAKPKYTITSSVESSENFEDEYFKVRTPLKEDNVIYVEGQVKTNVKRLCIRLKKHGSSTYYITAFVKPDKNGEFSIKINTTKGNKKVPTVIDGKGTVTKASQCYSTKPGYKAVGTMSAGIYHLTIAKATTTADASLSGDWWEGSLGGQDGYCLKNVLLRVKSGDPNNLKLIEYDSVMANNEAVTASLEPSDETISSYKGSYVRYKDKYLKDISFVLKNPNTGEVASSLTTKQVNYIAKVADKVTSGADTNYEKVQKIYEYVAKNFYYDNLAHEEYTNQYGNPYYNLYNLRNKVKSANSTSTGKVGTVCFGYASAVIAMARVEGIPARLVHGRHNTLQKTLWSEQTLSKINKSDHWWAEVYVDGRWVTVDANVGTGNQWERSSFSSSGTWEYTGLTSYEGFDPSVKIFANNFLLNTIYKGSSAGKYACYTDEVTQLRAFLNTKSSGVSNGKRLNSSYSSSKLSTWGTGESKTFETDGFGKVYRISWPKAELYGEADFSGFEELKYLTLYTNKLTALDISGCTSLKTLSATYNDLTTFDGRTATALETISLKGNELTSAKFKHSGKTVTIKSNYSSCNFSFNYSKSNNQVTIFAGKAPDGYEFVGIYNASGSKLSGETEYSFTPSTTASKTYTVKYKKVS